MTNAHVVAGVDQPSVLVRGTGKVWPARVDYIDPQVDVAVLYVPGLNAPTVEFARTLAERGWESSKAISPKTVPWPKVTSRCEPTLSSMER